MNTNTTDRPKAPRTLDAARQEIQALQEQLNLRGPGSSELTLLRAKVSNLESELEQGISAANKLGDTATVGRLYKELQTRPRCY